MRAVQGWTIGPILRQASGFTPRLASWDGKEKPSQIRLQSYLDEVQAAIGDLPPSNLYLHLDVDVIEVARLSRHHDLENYLTPLVHRLGAHRFVLVSAAKFVGGGSSVAIGEALPAEVSGPQLLHRCQATQPDGWKPELRTALLDSGAKCLPPGPVEVHQIFRCPAKTNWVSFWKPAGDAMGPVLGEPFPHNPFNPNDDRIVSLTMMRAEAETGLEIGLWWGAVGELVQPVATSATLFQATPPRPEATAASAPLRALGKTPGRVIDRIVIIARRLGADSKSVTLRELLQAYQAEWPDSPGSSEGSFSATLNYHTVNMRSRFQPGDRHSGQQAWIREPLFNRVSRGSYQLLSASRLEHFRQLLAVGDDRLYADEYDVEDILA